MRPTSALNIPLVQASQPAPQRTCRICVERFVMEIQEALRIMRALVMRALADGLNPGTGEALLADAVYQDAPSCELFTVP